MNSSAPVLWLYACSQGECEAIGPVAFIGIALLAPGLAFLIIRYVGAWLAGPQ